MGWSPSLRRRHARPRSGGGIRRVVTAIVLLSAGLVGVVAPSGASPARVPEAGTAALPAQAIGSVPDPAALGWRAVLNEDFDASLDESVWNVRKGRGLSPALNTRDAVRVQNSELTLTTYTDASGEDRTGEIALGEAVGIETPGVDWERRGAGFVGTYGYLEAKVKLQQRAGTGSAFWTLSPTWHKSPFGDPAASGPEFDIMEVYSTDPEKVIVGKHWDGFDEDHKMDTFARANPTSTPIQGNYHVYGMLWTPDGYRGYVDGIEVYRSTDAVTYSPEYILLSQFGGRDAGRPGGRPVGGYGPLGASTNATMTVDWVRMWQRPISEIPNQTFPANSPVSIPFSVQDYFYPSEAPGRSEPGSVRVTASVTSGSGVVPEANVVVTGNGPADPNGTFDNRGFESSLAPGGTPPPGNWAVPTGMGTATTWTTRKHSGSRALRLTQSGGRVEQTITGLQPSTTYMAGGWYNLDLGYTDSNGDGRVTWNGDANGNGRPELAEIEPLTPEAGDGSALVDWGVDVSSGTADPEDVKVTLRRHALTDASEGWWARTNDEWRWSSFTFTTGPSTTQVKLYVDNWAYRSGTDDSDLSFDDVWIQPMVPPNRTVTLRPNPGATGPATIRLTATDASGTALSPVEEFTVTFNRGSTFTNGGFETVPLGAGWNLVDGTPGKGADVVVETPFQLDRMLELGNGGAGFAGQAVSGLQPNTAYTLELTGRVASAPAPTERGLELRITGAAADPCANPSDCDIRSTTWLSPPKIVNFTTGPTGTIQLLLADWNAANGASYLDDVKLTTASPSAPVPPATAPTLSGIGERRIPSSAPYAIPVNHPSGQTIRIDSVTSDNQDLIPNRNVTFKSNTSGTGGVLSVTPVPDRTGKAAIRVAFTALVPIGPPDVTFVPIFVSDHRLANPGFNDGANGWSDATIATSGVPRTGTGMLQLNVSAPPTTQKLTWLPSNTSFVVSGYGKGRARMTLRRDGVDVHTVDWPSSSSSWSERRISFTTPGPCADCEPNGQRRMPPDTHPNNPPNEVWEVVLQDLDTVDGPSFVDDLALMYGPAASAIRDLSLHVGQTTHTWDTKSFMWVGRLPSNPHAASTIVSFNSSDTNVLPVSNLRVTRAGTTDANAWHVSAVSRGVVGRSTVTLTLTDPTTGYQTQRQFLVTVNAGDFNSGDFERYLAWANNSFIGATFDIPGRPWWEDWRFRSTPPTPTLTNFDNVLRVRHGVVAKEVRDLLPNTTYRLRFTARGQVPSASNPPPQHEPVRVVVTSSSDAFGAELARVVVDSPGSWSMYEATFRTGPSATGTTGVWLQIVDLSFPWEDPTTPWDDATTCFDSRPGEACFDDFWLSQV